MLSFRLTYFDILVRVIIDLLLITTAILFSPYRLFVYIYARIFKPHLKLIEPGITRMFCRPHIGDYFIPGTITVVITVGGNIPVEDFRRLFNQRILQYRHKDGTHSFRRLENTMESFMGYWFWSDEINFNLNQHIKLYKPEKEYSSCDQNFQKEIITQLSKQPWNKKRSPWEITVIPCKNSQTMFFFRWHHCLADGLSMARVMRLFMDTDTTCTNEQNTAKKGLPISPKLIISVPRDTVKAWDWPFETIPNLKETFHTGASFTKPFQVEAIKGIMSRHRVSFQTVLSTVSSSALQRALEECGLPVPKYVLSHCPLKTMNHPGKMTNDFLPGFWPMMVDCPSLKTRLMESEERLKEIKHSSLSLAQYYRVICASTLPMLICDIFFAWMLEKGTMVVNNFPFFGKMSLLGKEVVDMMAILDALPGLFDMAVLTTGCLNRIRFGVSTNNGFPIDSEKQCEYLELEMEKLMSEDSSTNKNES